MRSLPLYVLIHYLRWIETLSVIPSERIYTRIIDAYHSVIGTYTTIITSYAITETKF